MATRQLHTKDGITEEEYESDEERLCKAITEAKTLDDVKAALKEYFGEPEEVEPDGEPVPE